MIRSTILSIRLLQTFEYRRRTRNANPRHANNRWRASLPCSGAHSARITHAIELPGPITTMIMLSAAMVMRRWAPRDASNVNHEFRRLFNKSHRARTEWDIKVISCIFQQFQSECRVLASRRAGGHVIYRGRRRNKPRSPVGGIPPLSSSLRCYLRSSGKSRSYPGVWIIFSCSFVQMSDLLNCFNWNFSVRAWAVDRIHSTCTVDVEEFKCDSNGFIFSLTPPTKPVKQHKRIARRSKRSKRDVTSRSSSRHRSVSLGCPPQRVGGWWRCWR